MASAIGCFQPGTFLWGHAHAEALSKVTADGKYLPSTPDLEVGRRSPQIRSGIALADWISAAVRSKIKAQNVIETDELKAHFVERKPVSGSPALFST